MYLGGGVLPNRWVRYSLVGLCAILLVMTGSAKAIAAIPIAVLGSYLWVRTNKPALRLVTIITTSWGWLALSATGALEAIMSTALQLLGRDPTLSSRTLIWSAVLEGLQASPNWWLGGGYGAGWTAGISDMVRARLGSDTGHPHNGFIEVIIDLGIPGILILGLLMGTLFVKMIACQTPRQDERLRFVAAWFFLFALSNLVGSYLFAAGDLMTLMIFMCPLILDWKEPRRVRRQSIQSA